MRQNRLLTGILSVLRVVGAVFLVVAGLAYYLASTAAPASAQEVPAPLAVQAEPAVITVTAAAAQIVANGVSSTTITAIVVDADGRRVPGVGIRFQTDLGTFIGSVEPRDYTTSTNASGVARAFLRSATTAGTAHVTARHLSVVSGSVTVRFVPGPATQIALVAAPTQLVADGQARAAITATVRDINNNLVPSQTVAFRSLTRGAIAPLSTRTDALGVATATYTASITAGTVTVRAQAGVVTKTVDIAVVAGPARTATLLATPPSLVADNSMTSTVKITVRDQFNNPVINRTVLFSATLGTVTPRLPRTDASGVATTTFKAGRVAGAGIVTATIESVVVTRTIALRAGPPVTLTLTVSPTAIQANGSTTTTLQVLVRDQLGNPTPQTSVTFTSTGGAFSGSRVRTTDAAGYARVVLRSTTVAGTYAVTATVTGSEISRSGSVRFLPGPATKLSVAVAPTVLGANGSDQAFLTIIVTDAYTNRVPSWPISLTARLGTVTPQTTATSEQGTANATFTAGTVSGLAVVTVTTGLVTRTVSLPLLPGTPVSIHMTASTTAVVASTTSRVTISATVMDRFGNGAPGRSVTFSSHTGTPTYTMATTNANGVARMVLTPPNQVGETTVTAVTDGVVGQDAGRITIYFVAGRPRNLTLTTTPGTLPADGVSEAEVQARVTDSNNNPVPNVVVTFGATLGTVTPIGPATDATGVARTTFRAGNQSGSATVTALVPEVPSKTATITLRPAAASIGLEVNPLRVLADGIKYTTVTATVRSTVAPLAGITVTFDTTLGQITPGREIRSDSAGRAVVRVTSPTDPGNATLTVRADRVTETRTIVFFAGRYTVTLPIVIRFNPPLTPLVNGDFEAGPTAGWQQISNGAPATLIVARSNVPTPVRPGMGGNYLLWLGGTKSLNDSASQSVSLPTEYAASLIYRYYTTSGRPACGVDSGSLLINSQPIRVYALCETQVTRAWRTEFVDLAGYAGQQINIDFRATIVGGIVGNLYVDDVYLCSNDPAAPPGTQGCPAAAAAAYVIATPTTMPAAEVTIAMEVLENEAVAAADGVTVTVTTTATNVAVQRQATVRATVRNPDGSLAVGTPVTFTVAPAARGTVSPTVGATNSNGLASTTFTANQTLGSAVVTARALGVSSAVTLQVVAGQVVSLQLTANPMTLVANNVATATVRVIARDVFGNRAADRLVTFAALGGSLSPTRPSTDASGVATTTFRAGTVARTATVTVTTAGITQTLTLTLTAGPVNKVTVVAEPNPIVANGAATATVVALVQDRYNNPVPAKEVYFGANAGSFVGGIDAALTDAAGQAIVILLSTTTAQTATVTALVDNIRGSTRVGFIAGPPETVVVTATPAAIIANGVTTTTVRAVVRDLFGNPSPNTPVAFTSSAGVWSTGGNVTVTQTSQTGVATAILRSATTALTAIVSATTDSNKQGGTQVLFLPDAPGEITLTSDSSVLVADGVDTTTLVATVRDANGNLVGAVPVTFTAVGGSISPEVVVTDGFGRAVTTLTAGTAAGVATATARIAGGLLLAELAVTLSPGAPAHINLVVNPPQILADAESQAAVIATVMDAHDNPTPGITLTLNASPLVTITQGPVTDASGIATATVTARRRSGVATIIASASNAAQQTIITLLPAASALTLTAAPDVLIVDNGDTASITALVVEGDNTTPAVGVTVTFSTTLGVITPETVRSDGNGRAETRLDPQRAIGTARVTATANRITDQISVTLRPAVYKIYLPLTTRSDGTAAAGIVNGNFEDGPDVGWQSSAAGAGTSIILPVSEQSISVHTDAENRYVAGLSTVGAGHGEAVSLQQTFVLPPSASEEEEIWGLHYRYYIEGNSAPCEYYQVVLQAEDDDVTEYALCQSSEVRQWHEGLVRFSSPGLATITVDFRVLPGADDTVPSSGVLYLDEVGLCRIVDAANPADSSCDDLGD